MGFNGILVENRAPKKDHGLNTSRDRAHQITGDMETGEYQGCGMIKKAWIEVMEEERGKKGVLTPKWSI